MSSGSPRALSIVRPNSSSRISIPSALQLPSPRGCTARNWPRCGNGLRPPMTARLRCWRRCMCRKCRPARTFRPRPRPCLREPLHSTKSPTVPMNSFSHPSAGILWGHRNTRHESESEIEPTFHVTHVAQVGGAQRKRDLNVDQLGCPSGRILYWSEKSVDSFEDAAGCLVSWQRIGPINFNTATASLPRRRGDRIRLLFAALHMSAVGSAPRRRESSVEEESTRKLVD